jgi:hypothetical protein
VFTISLSGVVWIVSDGISMRIGLNFSWHGLQIRAIVVVAWIVSDGIIYRFK